MEGGGGVAVDVVSPSDRPDAILWSRLGATVPGYRPVIFWKKENAVNES